MFYIYMHLHSISMIVIVIIISLTDQEFSIQLLEYVIPPAALAAAAPPKSPMCYGVSHIMV